MDFSPWLGDINEYRTDATGNFRRAAAAIERDMTGEAVEDAALQFAFGVERCFKAVIASVNPILLLEATPVENVIPVLYRSRLKSTHKKHAEAAAAKADGLNSNTLGFKAAKCFGLPNSPTKSRSE